MSVVFPQRLSFLCRNAVALLQAAVRLPAIFGDHRVLQRDMKAPVWGWADPGVNLYNKENLPALPFRTDDWMVFPLSMR